MCETLPLLFVFSLSSGIFRAVFRQIAQSTAARCHLVHTNTQRTRQKKPPNASPTTWCPWGRPKPRQKIEPRKAARPLFSKVRSLQKIPPVAALVWTWNPACTKISRLGRCQPAPCPSAMWSPRGLIGAWSPARPSTPETKLRTGMGSQRWTLPSPTCSSLFSWITVECAAKPSRVYCSFHKKPTTCIYPWMLTIVSVHFFWYLEIFFF